MLVAAEISAASVVIQVGRNPGSNSQYALTMFRQLVLDDQCARGSMDNDNVGR